jgi:hypothetical protein
MIMDSKFYAIRFKNWIRLESDPIYIHFWIKIFLELYHFMKKHLDRDPLPPRPLPKMFLLKTIFGPSR